jgi:hypothetical protein
MSYQVRLQENKQISRRHADQIKFREAEEMADLPLTVSTSETSKDSDDKLRRYI